MKKKEMRYINSKKSFFQLEIKRKKKKLSILKRGWPSHPCNIGDCQMHSVTHSQHFGKSSLSSRLWILWVENYAMSINRWLNCTCSTPTNLNSLPASPQSDNNTFCTWDSWEGLETLPSPPGTRLVEWSNLTPINQHTKKSTRRNK